MEAVGEHARREPDPFLQVPGGLVELVEDGELLLLGEVAFGHQARDVVAIAAVGGDAAGGGVRMGDHAFVFERGHLVADGGARNAEGVALDQRLRSDGLGRFDEVIDDESEDARATV